MRTTRGKAIVFVGTFVLIGALTGALTACAGEGRAGGAAPAADATPTATSSPAPTVTEVPSATPSAAPVVAPNGLLVTAEALQLTSTDGSAVSFSYFDPTEGVVGALSTAFGSDPVVEANTPTIEPGPQTVYTWPGFVLVDDDWPATAPLDANFYVNITVPEINGVSLSTADDVQVGDSAVPLIAQYPTSGTGEDVEQVTVYFATVDVPRSDVNPRDGSTISVWVSTDNPAQTITSISAPASSYGT